MVDLVAVVTFFVAIALSPWDVVRWEIRGPVRVHFMAFDIPTVLAEMKRMLLNDVLKTIGRTRWP